MPIAYYNGDFADFSEIRIPLSDRSVFFGDGVYEACVGKSGKIFLKEEHFTRFFCNMRAIGLPLSFTEAKLSEILLDCIKRSALSEYFVYFQATGYLSERLHAPRDKTRSNLLVTVTPYKPLSIDSEIDLISLQDIRQSFCNIKSLNLLGSVLGAEEACSGGAQEAVFIRNGFVTECSRSNISIMKNGTLFTHPKCEFILPGITRRLLLECAKKLGIPYRESAFTPAELITADDGIVTSTSKLALRAKSFDRTALQRKKSAECRALIDEMFKCYREFC